MLTQERRKSERKEYANSVEIYSYETKKVIGNGLITNWSEGGFRVVASHNIKPGKKVIMFFDLLSGYQFDMLGEVVHAEKNADSKSFGIKFAQNHPELISKLSQQFSVAC